jgi:hypothetical protein
MKKTLISLLLIIICAAVALAHDPRTVSKDFRTLLPSRVRASSLSATNRSTITTAISLPEKGRRSPTLIDSGKRSANWTLTSP